MPMESPVPAKPPNKGFRELRTLSGIDSMCAVCNIIKDNRSSRSVSATSRFQRICKVRPKLQQEPKSGKGYTRCRQQYVKYRKQIG